MRELNRKAAELHGITACEDLADCLKVDIPVQDGDCIICGDLHVSVIALPGHTRCSVGYYLRENKLLLGTETLGVYFGNNTYLPSFLVGYQSTLDAFGKVNRLEMEQILLPHYGVVAGEGKTREEILAFLTERDYGENVAPTYPIDAFRLNTEIMIELVRKERMEQSRT